MHTARNILLSLSLKYNGHWPSIYKAMKEKESLPDAFIDNALDSLPEGINFITIIDDDYPQSLKGAKFPPFVIFYRGNPDMLLSLAEFGVGIFGNLIWDEHKDNQALTTNSDMTVIYSWLSDGSVADAIKAKRTIYIGRSMEEADNVNADLVISESLLNNTADDDLVTGFTYRLLFNLPSNILFVGCKRFKDIVVGIGMLSNSDASVYSLATVKETTTNYKLIHDANAFSISNIDGIVDPDNRSDTDVVVDA